MEAEILEAIHDIIHPKGASRSMNDAWKKLFELEKTTKFLELNLNNGGEILEEIDERFAGDFRILSENDTFDVIKKNFLEKFAKLKVLEEHFGFNFSSIDSSTFKAYREFKEKISQEELNEEIESDFDVEYSMEIKGLPDDDEIFLLEFTAKEWKNTLEEQQQELENQQKSFEKNKLLGELFLEYKEQIMTSINGADAKGLENIVANIRKRIPSDMRGEVSDVVLFSKCINNANPEQGNQLLKIAENLSNDSIAQIVVSGVTEESVKLEYIGERLGEDSLRKVATCDVRLEQNTSERKKLHIYNPMNWGPIYRLSREKKQINNDRAIAVKNFNEQGLASLKSSKVTRLMRENDIRNIVRKLLDRKKIEVLQEMQNSMDNSQNFLSATVVADERTRQANAVKQAEIQQQLQQQKCESTSMQIGNQY